MTKPLPHSRFTGIAEVLIKSPVFMAVHFCLAIACLVVILSLDKSLKSTDATGYSSLEYAGSKDSATAVIVSWSPRQHVLAAFSAGFHYLFMLLYATFLMIALAWSAAQDVCPEALVKPLCILALVQPVGIVFDACNQAVNINSLANGPSEVQQKAHVAFGVIHVIILAVAILFSVGIRLVSLIQQVRHGSK